MAQQSIAAHEKALSKYQSGNWQEAKQLFTTILEQEGHALHRVYLQRMEELNFQSPPGWNGVYTHTSK